MNTELEQLKYQIISSIVSLNDIGSLSEVKKFLTDIYTSHDKAHDKTKIAKNEVSNSVDSQVLFWEIACLAAIDYQKAIEKLTQQPLSFLFEFEEILAQKLYNLDKKELAFAIYDSNSVSKDDFLYVRCYIICQGKFFYEKILSGEILMINQTFEALLYLSEKAYFEKTNKEFPVFPTSVSYETGSNKNEWI